MIRTIVGNNSFAVDMFINQLTQEYTDKYGAFSIEHIDASEKELSEITDSLLNLAFLSPNKLIILRSPSTNKQFSDKFESLIDSIPETTELVIIEQAIDKRSSFFKFLKKSTNFESFDELDARELANWALTEVKNRGGSITNQAADYLVLNTGTNQLRVGNEISKLISYNQNINKETIDLLVEPIAQTTIFQLLDEAFAGNRQKVVKIYNEQRRQKVEPQKIIAMLNWQLINLSLVKTAGDRSVSEISSDTKLNPFVVRKSLDICNKISYQRLKELISKLFEIDLKLKKVQLDADDVLLGYLLTIS